MPHNFVGRGGNAVMYVRVVTTNPEVVLNPLDLTMHVSSIEEKYKGRVSVFYWRIHTIDSKGGGLSLTVPNDTDTEVLCDCLQECLPRHGVILQ